MFVISAKELVASIDSCKVLQYLDLEGNTLGNFVFIIPDKHLIPNLNFFYCKNIFSGVEAAKSIGKALEKHPEFKKALFKDLFTGRMKTEIPIALESLGKGMIVANAKITVLDCSDNALGPNGMKGLVDLIKSSTCYSLQELKLNNCGLGITGGKMLAQSLTECYEKSVAAGTPLSLKVFIAGRNRLENEGAKALAQIFGKIGTFEEIAIPQNGIYWVGMTALSEALKENTNLRILNLNDNTIGPKGANALSDAFYSLQALKEINFGDCLLKSEGALALSEALGDGHSDLEIVNFSGNEIGPDGGESLVASMHGKEFLRELNLDANCFGEESIDIMRDAMKSYNKLDALIIEEDEGLDEEQEEENGDTDDEGEYDEEIEDETDEYDEGEDDNEEGVFYIPEVSLQNQSTFETSLEPVNESTNGYVPEDGTVSAFCYQQNPTLEQFNQIKDQDKVAAFKEYLKVRNFKCFVGCKISNEFLFILGNSRRRLFSSFSFYDSQVRLSVGKLQRGPHHIGRFV